MLNASSTSSFVWNALKTNCCKMENEVYNIEPSNLFYKRREIPLTPHECVKIARRAFDSKKTKSIEFREAQLKNLQKMYNETEHDMFDALAKDLRKHKQETSVSEVEFLRNDIKNILMHFKAWIKPQNREKDLANLLNDLQIYSDPLGVVLIIGAWNLPIQLTFLPLAGAIAGGNCVIMKPSEMAPASAKYMATTLPRYIDPECYQIFEGGITETAELLKERFDYIFFTGSPQVGKIVYEAAAKYLTPTTLELGGKNPTYIDSTADIDIVAARLYWGNCTNAGQICIAPDYVLCTKAVQDKLIPAFRKLMDKWYAGNAKNSPDYCRIINERHFNRLMNLMQSGTIALGGDSDANELYIEPTILINVKPDDDIMTEEVFGPILPILNIDNVVEAVNFINSREKPLVLYIFSSNKNDIEFILNSTSSGGVTVNDTLIQVTVESLPFGGVGNSGMGSYHGKRSFDIFVHKKSVLKKNFALIPEMLQSARYPPYSDNKMKLVSFLLKKRPAFPIKSVTRVLIFVAGMLAMYLLHYIFT